jgi:hypothetical protein
MPPELKTQLQALSKERGVSLSEIGLAAIEEFFAKRARPELPLQEAVAQLGAQVAHLEAFLEGFVRVFFTVTPDPQEQPLAAQRQAARRGAERFAQLQARIAPAKEA